MKAFLMLVTLCMTASAGAQPVFEGSYPANRNGGFASFSAAGDKYYVVTPAGQATIYNLDHSVWKTFSLAVPSGYQYYDGLLFSDHLFNTDDLVEVMYPASNATDSRLRVVREDGLVVFDTIGGGLWQLQSTAAGYKLMIYGGYGFAQTFRLYGLPGTLPCKACSDVTQLQPISPSVSLRVFPALPNPSNGTVRIGYTLAVSEPCKIVIYDSNGVEAMHKMVSNAESFVDFDVSQLPAGIYLYRIVGLTAVSNTERLVVQH